MSQKKIEEASGKSLGDMDGIVFKRNRLGHPENSQIGIGQTHSNDLVFVINQIGQHRHEPIFGFKKIDQTDPRRAGLDVSAINADIEVLEQAWTKLGSIDSHDISS